MSIGLSVARVCVGLSLCLGMNLAPLDSVHAAIVVDFEEFVLGSDGYLNGPAPEAVRHDGDNGDYEDVGQYKSQGVGFSNINGLSKPFAYWSGFAISNHVDSQTAGWGNQYSAFPGSGDGPSSQYGVAYVSGVWEFNSSDADKLRQLPSIYIPPNMQADSMMISNTTYAALSMENGGEGAKKFGGVEGRDADYFKLTVFGIDSNNQVLGDSVDFMLADYRSANSEDDYVLNRWKRLDLALLAGAQSLHFNLESSDTSIFGGTTYLNTPSYFAIDNLKLSAVPEPSGLLLLACMGLGLAFRRARASDS